MIQDTLQRQSTRETISSSGTPVELGAGQSKALGEVLALLDQHGGRKGIALFGARGSGKTTVVNELARAPRTPQHRKVVCATVNAAKLPSDLAPWQRLIFATLDKLAQQPGAPRTVVDLGAELQELVQHEANNDESATLAAAAFAHHFRSAFSGMVNSAVSISNGTFLVVIDHLDKTTGDKAAQLLEAARYFLNAPNCATLISADEVSLLDQLDDEGRAALYEWMTSRVDLRGRPPQPAPAPMPALQPVHQPAVQRAAAPRPISSDIPQPCVQILTQALGDDRYALEAAGDYWRGAMRNLARRNADGHQVNVNGQLIAKLSAMRVLSPALFDAARFDVPLLTTLERRARSTASLAAASEASDTWSDAVMSDARLQALFRMAPTFIGLEARDLATALRLVSADQIEAVHTIQPAPTAQLAASAVMGAATVAAPPAFEPAAQRDVIAATAATATPVARPRREAAQVEIPAAAWTMISVAAGTFIVDRLAKLVAQSTQGALGGLIRLEPPAAQGLVNNGLAIGAELVGLALCALILIFWGATGRSRAHAVAFGLIIGGLAANLFDRVAHGSVMNYIHLGNLPVFNLAHAALLAGAFVLAFAIVTGGSRSAKPAP